MWALPAGDILRYHIIEDHSGCFRASSYDIDHEEEGYHFTVSRHDRERHVSSPFVVSQAGRAWQQTDFLADVSAYIRDRSCASTQPELLPVLFQTKLRSTRDALEAAQIDGCIVPRARDASLALDYAPALRSLVASQAANAASSTRRRFVFVYSFGT